MVPAMPILKRALKILNSYLLLPFYQLSKRVDTYQWLNENYFVAPRLLRLAYSLRSYNARPGY